jgi:hypothetical protein
VTATPERTALAFSVVVARAGEVLGQRSFEARSVKIGRDAGCDFQIDHPTLSRQHALIERAGQAWTITDLGSQNGTLVNGKKPGALHALNVKDEIQLGEFTLIFHGEEPVPANIPLIQNQSAYAVFGQTLKVHSGDHEQRERSASVHAHLLEASGRVWALDRDVLLLGRGEGCHVRTGGFFAPRVAAAIVRGHGGWSLVKLGRGSVTVRGAKIADREWLAEGDTLTVSGRAFTFKPGLPD